MLNPSKAFPLLIAILISVIYLNSLPNSYVWDDRLNFSENEAIRDLPSVTKACFSKNYHRVAVERYYRPVVTLSFALEYRAWKLNPVASHAVNISLHILTSISLFFLLSLLFGSRVVPAAATLLFATHPAATNSVAYVNGRMEIFCALFSLLSTICFLKARMRGEKSFLQTAGSLFFFALALLSKEMALTIPLIFLLLHFTFPPAGPNRPLTSPLPHFLLAAAYFIFRIYFIAGSALDIDRSLPPVLTLLTMLKAVTLYMRVMFLPVRLCADYFSMPIPSSFFSADALAPLLAVSAAIVVAAVSIKRNRFIFFSISWFFITLAPVMNILPLLSFVSERFLYIPSIGFCVFAAVSLDSFIKYLKFPKLLFWVAALSIAAAYSAGTIARNPVWKDELTLFSDTAECSPNSVSAHVKLGNTLCDLGRCDEAVGEYEKAISLRPDPVIYNNLGEAYAREGNYKKAAEAIRRYFNFNPSDIKTCLRLGIAYELSGNLGEAVATLHKCELIAPADTQIAEKTRILESRLENAKNVEK